MTRSSRARSDVPGGRASAGTATRPLTRWPTKARAEAERGHARRICISSSQKMVMADVPSVPLFNPDTAVLVLARSIGNPFHPAYFIDLDEIDVTE